MSENSFWGESGSSPPSLLVGVSKLANALGISPSTIYYLKATDPNFPYIKIGKHLRFEIDKVLAYYRLKTRRAKEQRFKSGSPISSLTTEYEDNANASDSTKES